MQRPATERYNRFSNFNYSVANPIGQIWSGALMLDFLGYREAHDAILAAIEAALQPNSGAPRTPDIGGTASTADLGKAIAAAVEAG